MYVRKLDLSGCTEINTSNLWFILDGMPSLYDLNLSYCCNLETLLDNIQNNSLLEVLNLDECSKLKSLPKLPTSLKQLTAINCIYLDTNILHKFHFTNAPNFRRSDICYLPGGQVPSEFKFQTTKASIDIPHIPKSGLCGFIFCIVLSEGLNFRKQRVGCTIYEHGKEILHLSDIFVIENTFENAETLILDHVLLCSKGHSEDYKLLNMGNKSDHYNLSFEFKLLVPGSEYANVRKEEWSSKGIKGCGVFPAYGLEHSGFEIVELQTPMALVNYNLSFEFKHLVPGGEYANVGEKEWWSSTNGVIPVYGISELQSSAQFSHESDINEFESDRVEIDELQFTFSGQVSDESDQQIIPRKEKEALQMRMKLKLEALQMKMKMNINKLIFPRNKRGGLE
ncbi:hypothetical protein QL285_013883 [Trifolium repens]|nr:hypothetical protein QL285_013883 [Trifolium repens]